MKPNNKRKPRSIVLANRKEGSQPPPPPHPYLPIHPKKCYHIIINSFAFFTEKSGHLVIGKLLVTPK